MTGNMHLPHDHAQVVYGTPKVLGLKLLETETSEFVELTLLKGGNVPPHSLDIPAAFYIAEGRGTLAINGIAIDIRTGDMVTSGAGTVREVTNTGEEELRILVIKQKA